VETKLNQRPSKNNKDLKILNRMLVLNTIRHKGPIARSEIAKLIGLVAPTVTVIVNQLIKKKIIQEVGRGESSGGRKPVMLELNPRAGYIFAVRVQRGEIVTALLDLASNLLENRRQMLDTTNAEDVVAAIGSSFDLITANLQIAKNKVLCCGVASPGLVDSHCGIVERSSNMVWGRVPLGEMLSQRLTNLPVHIENISNAAALGEKMYGSGSACANLIYLNLSVGIGAGIIINNQLFGGAHGYAGEIGTVTNQLNPEGLVNYSNFEMLCGIRAIVNKVKAAVTDETFRKYGLSKNRINIFEILHHPWIEIPAIREILLETSHQIGIKVAELVNLFNTEMVVLGGELTWAGNLLLNTVAETVEKNTLPEMSESVKIIISTMKEDPPLMGAYALVLEKLFQSEPWLSDKIID
jgi:predicted NBD/HSP70 family sugar kinase